MSGEALYQATRKWWKVRPHRHKPDYAFAVAAGNVRGVYATDHWEQDPTSKRWAFEGAVHPDLERLYLGQDVSGYFHRGAQNPIRYVNC